MILCVFGVARSLGATNGSLFNGSANPKFNTKIAFIKLILLAILIYPLTKKWGIVGTSLATTLPVFASQSYGFFKVSKILQCKLRNFLLPFSIPIIGVALMLLLAYAIKNLLLNIITSTTVYLAFIFYISKYYESHYDVIKILREFTRWVTIK